MDVEPRKRCYTPEKDDGSKKGRMLDHQKKDDGPGKESRTTEKGCWTTEEDAGSQKDDAGPQKRMMDPIKTMLDHEDA